MSSIASVGGASSAWSDMSPSRASAMKEKLFAKADTNGDGKVDQAELQTLFDKIAKKTGTTAADAATQFSKMDTNGDGSLSADELATGMKSLRQAAKSTVDFAQQHTGGPPRVGGHHHVAKADGDGDDAGTAASSSASGSSTSSSTSSSSTATDPLDTNGDGVVSPQERAAGTLKDLLQLLVKQAYGSTASNAANAANAVTGDATATATASLSLAA